MTTQSLLWCEFAWLGDPDPGLAQGVLLRLDSGRIVSVDRSQQPPASAQVLSGLTLPGLANAHSHAFHRGLRGFTQKGQGTFWTWREQMYGLAARLEPDNYYRLARAVFAEMLTAGITVVGEFHYIHHRPDGKPYDNANAMGEALIAAAREAGIRLTLLETLYLRGGFAESGPSSAMTGEVASTTASQLYLPVLAEQRRFSDNSVESYIARTAKEWQHSVEHSMMRVGAAAHSIRAVPPDELNLLANWARDAGRPLHIHVSEQPAENSDCKRMLGDTPVSILDACGVLGPATTLVHATHLERADIELIARSGTGVCFCPTTERDLADGVGPSAELSESGVEISVGSDSHAVIDLLEEVRLVEYHQRLVSNQRGVHDTESLLDMAAANGYRSLGWPEGGAIRPGAVADFITVGLGSARIAGATPESILPATVFGANSADVKEVFVAGHHLVTGGRHRHISVPEELSATIGELRSDEALR